MPTPLELGIECLKAHKVDDAIKHFEEATTSFPNDYLGFNYLGIAYAQKGHYNRAIGAFLAAIQLRPNNANLHFNLGLAYKADGLGDQARDQFQQALLVDQNYEKAREALKVMDSETDDSLSQGACARHTDEPAVAVCSYCRLPICKECKTVVHGTVLCTRCAEQQSRKE